MRTHPLVRLTLILTFILAVNAYVFGVLIQPWVVRSEYVRIDKVPCSVFVPPAPKGCHP